MLGSVEKSSEKTTAPSSDSNGMGTRLGLDEECDAVTRSSEIKMRTSVPNKTLINATERLTGRMILPPRIQWVTNSGHSIFGAESRRGRKWHRRLRLNTQKAQSRPMCEAQRRAAMITVVRCWGHRTDGDAVTVCLYAYYITNVNMLFALSRQDRWLPHAVAFPRWLPLCYNSSAGGRTMCQ